MDYTVKPIIKWPGELTKYRQSGKFDSSYAKTLELLDREIGKLAGKNVVIQLALEFGSIRNDGRPYADAKPSHPGVIVTFNSKYGPLSYHTDRYHDWHANVRAIGLALEALRAVDRYGVSKAGQQYTGYKRLPESAGNGRKKIETKEEAARWFQANVTAFSQIPLAVLTGNIALIEPHYRGIAGRFHPDNKETGDEGKFVELQEAMAVLKGSGS